MKDDPIFDFIFKHFSKIWLAIAALILVFWCFVGVLAIKAAPIVWNALDNVSQQIELEDK